MDEASATMVLSALSNVTRFRCYSLLMTRGHATSGELSEALRVPTNTMSGHLAILSQAGLTAATRSGRNVTYVAIRRPVSDLLAMLSEVVGSD